MPRRNGKEFKGYRPGRPKASENGTRRCEWPGCTAEGLHRAPRPGTDDVQWLCLEHVRRFNESWDYFRETGCRDIESEIRLDTVGRRPTWPFGTRAGTFQVDLADLKAAFARFERAGGSRIGGEDGRQRNTNGHRYHRAAAETEDAMVVLDLRPPLSLASVKARYKKLVKLHHPDANGGDKGAEERFKKISQAYQTLLKSLAP